MNDYGFYFYFFVFKWAFLEYSVIMLLFFLILFFFWAIFYYYFYSFLLLLEILFIFLFKGLKIMFGVPILFLWVMLGAQKFLDSHQKKKK